MPAWQGAAARNPETKVHPRSQIQERTRPRPQMGAELKARKLGGGAAEDFDPRTAGLSDIFPLEEPITLTYYIRANGAMTATMETYAEVEFFKELEKMTNVHIEWNHNTSDENFALMVNGGQLPDMINWQLGNAAGGAVALVEDGVILDLTEMLP